ncbi:MAG: aldo/keto reductase [Thermoanaerobaculia bacterium]|nr:aldo/keto reductase [Thermoanaerobaculia bacterium]
MKRISIENDSIPALGLGTWQLQGSEATSAVEHALHLGYRHLDTAQAYDNEREVGAGISRSSVPRDEIFLTTKVWWENLEADDVLRSTEASLRRLGTDHVDLLLVHWPPSDEIPLDEPLTALTTLMTQGKTRHIGVSNFTPTLMEKALEKGPIACDQVEFHPFLGQDELLELARNRGFVLTAYSPLARGRVLEEEALRRIGEGHGKTPAQVALRWLIQQESVAAIPKASDPGHREENLAIFDFELSSEEMEAIRDLDRGERLIDPEFAPNWDQ